MQQLVGRACIRCGKKISSILDSRFCATCGNPVHDKCAKSATSPNEPDQCPQCGGNRSDPAAQRLQFEQARRAGGDAGPEYPVATVCPACGHDGFKRIDPQKWITYAMARECLACGTRYTVPTPSWAGILTVVAGLVLVGLALVGGMFSLRAADAVTFSITMAMGILGVLALFQGTRVLLGVERNQDRGKNR